jgi:large subunit ribosomal protein L3
VIAPFLLGKFGLSRVSFCEGVKSCQLGNSLNKKMSTKMSTKSTKQNPHRLMGRKRGMTQLFDQAGKRIVCTVIEVEPNVVSQVKNSHRDGYEAVQVGFEQVRACNEKGRKRVTKPLQGHFEKAGIPCQRFLQEFRVGDASRFSVGESFALSLFEGTTFVDVTAVSKGKGFQGVMKLHGFAGGPASHGSGFHRTAGSTGMRSTPGRCLPGGKRASRMGGKKKTVQNLRIFKLIPEKNLILVQGAVPGHRGALVTLSEAVKKPVKN